MSSGSNMGFTLYALILVTVVGLVEVALMRVCVPHWWRTRTGKLVAVGAPALTLVSTVLWIMARSWGLGEFQALFQFASSAGSVFTLALLLAWPVAGVLHLADWLWEKRRQPSQTRAKAESSETVAGGVVDPSRRAFLRSAAIIAPATAFSASGAGVLNVFNDVAIREFTFRFENLPPALDGFRILQLCDSHIGYSFTIRDFDRLAERLSGQSFDMVALIGDVADDLDALPTALSLADQLRPRYGVFATLGNHEFYRGIGRVLKAYDASPVPLLINSGSRFAVGDAQVYVGGANDPVSMGWGFDSAGFYDAATRESLFGAQPGDFVIYLTHRPGGFEPASQLGANLILAGHTHGGQVGLFNRSLFERFVDNAYLWGHYRLNQSQLYTSAGVGQWFPFRLGCPSEAPIITLRRA